MRWERSPDEFAYTWDETGDDRYPDPLDIIEATRTVDERRALHAELATRMPHRGDERLSIALRLLAQPELRVIVIGHTEPEPDGPAQLRVAAVADRVHAVLVTQGPGEVAEFGGAIHIWLGNPGELPARVEAAFPANGPGSLPPLVATAAEVNGAAPRRSIYEPAEPPPARKIRKVLRANRIRAGWLQTEAHLDEPRRPCPVVHAWIDVADDGRYLVHSANDVAVTPAVPGAIASVVAKAIELNRDRFSDIAAP